MTLTEPRTIENTDQLLELVATKNTNLNLDLLTSYDHDRLWTIWTGWTDTENISQDNALADVIAELEDWLAGRWSPVCPHCGSTSIIELRDAVVYLKVKSVSATTGGTHCGEPDDHAVSVFESADVWRCDDCDYETEDMTPIRETAKLGSAEQGVRVIAPRIHVTATINETGDHAARVMVFDSSVDEWGPLTGPDTNLFPLPISDRADIDQIDEVLQLLAGEITDCLDTIENAKEPVERHEEGYGYQLNDLFETIGFALTAAVARRSQTK